MRWVLALLYLVLAMPLTIRLALVMPPFEVADEPSHFLRAVQVGQGGIVATATPGIGGVMPQAADDAHRYYDTLHFRPQLLLDRAAVAKAASLDWHGPTTHVSFANTAIYPPLFYLPAALAIDAGRAASMHVIATLRLARVATAVTATAFGTFAIAGNPAMLLMPYVFGPILFGPEATGTGEQLWWHAGGYVGVPLVFLSILSICQRDRVFGPLRWMLAGWLLLTLGKALGWQPISFLFDLVPFVRHTMFYVYIVPSWEMATVVLASLAIEGWARGDTQRLPRLAAATTTLLAAMALWAARGEILRLFGAATGYLRIAVPTTFGLVVLAIAVLYLIRRPPTRARIRLLLVGMVAASIVDFSIPLLSMARPRPLDLAPVAFLRKHLGTDRFFSMFLLQPNYGSFYQIASINHIALPVPQNWVDALHDRLSRTMDGVTFFGNGFRIPGAGFDALADALDPPVSNSAAAAALAALSVRYVVLPHGVDPFGDTIGTQVVLHDGQASPLLNGASLTIAIRSQRLARHVVDGIGVELGTFVGTANGVLDVSACNGGRCVSGSASVTGAPDNGLLWTSLTGSLPLDDTGTVDIRLRSHDATRPAALWLWPVIGGNQPKAPAVVLHFEPGGTPRPPVYTDPLVDIRELTDVAPYMSDPTGRCRIGIVDRRHADAVCSGPGMLVRRELMFPGWRAIVNGHPSDIKPFDTILQSVALPAGASTIRLAYEPPFIGWAEAAMALGSVCFLVIGAVDIAFLRRRYRDRNRAVDASYVQRSNATAR